MLFSTPLVQALKAGRKTQTRRPIKDVFCGGNGNGTGRWSFIAASTERGREIEYARVRPPCLPGDLIYVREMWSAPWEYEHTKPSEIPPGEPIHYWADGNPEAGDWMRPRPSLFMPKWASRLWLRVTDVRVERVQDITPDDAIAEGVFHGGRYSTEPGIPYPVATFAAQWRSIYGESWDRNDWVWRIAFERCAAPARENGR